MTAVEVPARRAGQVLPRPAPQRPLPPGRRRITVGVDGSYWGRRALQWAAQHAWLVGAELDVHVAPVPEAGWLGQGSFDDGIGHTLRTFPLLPVRLRSSSDAVGSLIAASRQSELVVLGCRGDTRAGHGVGASVLPVIDGARCDVVVVGGRPEAARGVHRRATVLLGTGADEAALRSAVRVACQRRVPLRLVRVVPVSRQCSLADPIDDVWSDLEAAAERVRAEHPTMRLTTQVVRSDLPEVAADPGPTDLLVVAGTGPATRAALFHGAAPVLIARAR